MSHKTQGKRASQRDWEQTVTAGGRCPCGKLRLLTKADAKKVLRRMKGRKGRMHAYECDGGVEGAASYWHIGHVPKDLKKGAASRDDIEARREFA